MSNRDGGGVHIACAICGEKISLVDGVGPVGAKVFTCPSCGSTFRIGDDDTSTGN